MITNNLSKKLVDSIYSKLLLHLKTDNYSELARGLGCHSKQQIHNCKQEGKIQTNRVINYALQKGINLCWLFNQSAWGNSIQEKIQSDQKEANKTYRKLIDFESESKEE